MPRYSDRYGSNTRLYVGHLSSRTRSYDLEDIFSRYGRVRDVDMKRDYAFVDFSDPRDADDARHGLDGRDIDGSRVIVEFAKGVPRGPGGLRDHGGRGPPPGSGRCFNCGIDGHWARDCKSGDWRNKCYKCGERGHIERNCQNSPKKPRRGRSYSRSPSPRRRSPSPRRDRSRTRSFSRSRSYSQSRSPPKRDRAVERVDRSRSPRVSRSPKRQRGSPVSSRGRKRTPSSPASRSPRRRGSPSRSPPRSPRHRGSPSRSPPRSPRHRGSPSRSPSRSPLRRGSRSPPRSPRHRGSPSRSPPCSPRHDEKRGNGSDYGGSPRLRSQSPIIERESPHNGNVRSPYEENGQDRSASPAARNDGRDVNDGDYGQASPAGSE